jgi:hypothetical protein
MRQLGGAFGVAILSAAFTASGSYASSSDFADGMRTAMIVAGGLCAAGALAGLVIAPHRRTANTHGGNGTNGTHGGNPTAQGTPARGTRVTDDRGTTRTR